MIVLNSLWPQMLYDMPCTFEAFGGTRLVILCNKEATSWPLMFLFFVYSQAPLYEMFWGIAYLIFVSLVVWYAWKWTVQEA